MIEGKPSCDVTVSTEEGKGKKRKKGEKGQSKRSREEMNRIKAKIKDNLKLKFEKTYQKRTSVGIP